MSERTSKYGYVLYYASAMMAVVALVAAVLIVALYLAQKESREAHDRVALYHLRSTTLSAQLADDLRTLEDIVRGAGETSAGAQPGTSGDALTPVGSTGPIYRMRARLSRLNELQEHNDDVRFAATLARIVERVDRVERQLVDFGAPPSAALPAIEVLGLNIEQLIRLHENAASDSLADYDSGQSSVAVSVIVLGGTLGVGALLVWYLIRLLRATLGRQALSEEALAESQERVHHMQKLDALGQLVGGVAHDFNNILTAILGQTTLLRASGNNNGETDFALGQIQQAAEQAASLTQQLLAFSRRQKLETRVIDLNPVLRNMEPMLRRLVGEDIDVLTEYADGPCVVELDAGLAEQMLMNLAVNARDAMKRGGKLRIATNNMQVAAADERRAGLAAGEYARLTVSDSGVGMSPEVRERIFEPFFTTKPKGRGTGLGLSSVHGIVSGGAGHVFVDSRPGEGTRFEICLPRSERQLEVATADASPETDGSGSETVLVVEDNEQIREFLQAGLSHLGYRVLIAPSGEAGLDICRRETERIDVILSDVIMAGMNGSEFIRQALTLCGNAVAIYMSGYTDDIVLKGGVTGIDIPLLHKPFTLDALTSLLRRELRENYAQAESHSAVPL